jgi:hypothetical protein
VTRTRGTFGSVEQLSGGHYRARYVGPDGRRYKARMTFVTIKDARGWLAIQQADIIRKAWVPPRTIRTCDQTVYGQPLNTHCKVRTGPDGR